MGSLAHGDALARQGIETRASYGRGLSGQDHFAPRLPSRASLPVTDDLAPRVLGLPMAPDLTDGQINVVAIALAEALERYPNGAESGWGILQIG